MRITPLDIRKQEFRKAMRGLESEEVYAFLATVAEEYEAALSDNKALRERVLELDDKVQEYRSMERTLRDTLLTAERVTADAKENARREADLIIKEAQIEAEKVLRDIKTQAMKLRQEVQELRRERDNYLARMKMLAESYLRFIQGEEREFEKSDRSGPPTLEEEALRRTAAKKPILPVSPKPEAYRPQPETPAVTPPKARVMAAAGIDMPVPPIMEPAVMERTGAAIPDLNAILDRMVANQEEMFKSEESGEALADPPDMDEARPKAGQAPAAPARFQMNATGQTAPAGSPAGLAAQPQEAPSAYNSQAEEWTLDKIRQDILANLSSRE